ncbi:MAG: septum formation initiator family protein [Phascolarctobacterium sp.]|nr:septum formation initiator family protein [Phascolarctobacterium sp.]
MRRRKNRSSKDFNIVLWIFVLICLFIIGRQEYSIYKIRQEEIATQKRIEELKKNKEALEKERKLLDDPKYIEKLARDDYNMVGKDEVPLFIVEPDKENGNK